MYIQTASLQTVCRRVACLARVRKIPWASSAWWIDQAALVDNSRKNIATCRKYLQWQSGGAWTRSPVRALSPWMTPRRLQGQWHSEDWQIWKLRSHTNIVFNRMADGQRAYEGLLGLIMQIHMQVLTAGHHLKHVHKKKWCSKPAGIRCRLVWVLALPWLQWPPLLGYEGCICPACLSSPIWGPLASGNLPTSTLAPTRA